MKRLMVITGILFAMTTSCRQKIEPEEPKVVLSQEETKTVQQVSPLITKFATFANSTYSDSIAIDQFFICKEIDVNGVVETVDIQRAISLYRKMTKNKKSGSWPIFEVKGTDNAILPIEGVGFGGAIWAKVLVDRKALEIKKIEFEHKAESEGYGAVMTQTAFEEKFVGTKINLEKNTFRLKNSIEKRSDDGVIIDGISGATMTSQSAVEMVNHGLQQYRGYLEQH